MAMRLSSEALKPRLSGLIDTSEALKTISKEEKDERVALMMSASPRDMAKYIGVFEDELGTLSRIEKESIERTEEAKRLRDEETRKKLIATEKKSRIEDDERAKTLLKQLDRIA